MHYTNILILCRIRCFCLSLLLLCSTVRGYASPKKAIKRGECIHHWLGLLKPCHARSTFPTIYKHQPANCQRHRASPHSWLQACSGRWDLNSPGRRKAGVGNFFNPQKNNNTCLLGRPNRVPSTRDILTYFSEHWPGGPGLEPHRGLLHHALAPDPSSQILLIHKIGKVCHFLCFFLLVYITCTILKYITENF